MIWIKRLLVLVVVLSFSTYVVLFTLSNNTLVNIHLIFFSLSDVKIELALVLSFVFGGLLGLLAIAPLWYSLRKKYRVAMAQASIDEL